MNVMKQIRIEKLTLNIGAGKDQTKLEKAILLLQHLTGITPVKTITDKRIPTWGLRPGLPVGCKLTLRGDAAAKMFERLLKAKNNKLTTSHVDDHGNLSLGIHEYIDVPGIEYEPKIGIIGFQACITLERPGYRIKRRKNFQRPIKHHLITKEEAMQYFKDTFKVEFEE